MSIIKGIPHTNARLWDTLGGSKRENFFIRPKRFTFAIRFHQSVQHFNAYN